MHSRIFQISNEPINERDYISEYHYDEHWFTNSVADYVGESDRKHDIEWLRDCQQGAGLLFGSDAGGEYFIIEDKQKYFTEPFEDFKKLLKELSATTLEDFSTTNLRQVMYELKKRL